MKATAVKRFLLNLPKKAGVDFRESYDFCQMAFSGKIINDPVHGFISIDDPFIMQVINHPWYQRLRRIHQMAFAHLVYPGAVHTRLAHSLGAYHLMGQALLELQRKGIAISGEEEQATKLAILLHDIGHGPFSHALESNLVAGVHHEQIGIAIMRRLNRESGGGLDLALSIFENRYEKPFLHQLISGQLDMDRLDYLTRDSFYTGVSEGVIGYDRIIKMLTVADNELVVEEKAIYSIEKFLVSRRLMYWQVYLHKTVIAAEQMLLRIVQRARQIAACSHGELDYLLQHDLESADPTELLNRFTRLDDVDVMMAIKNWQHHPDKVLSTLSRGLLYRRLLKVRYTAGANADEELQEKKALLEHSNALTPEEIEWFVFSGTAINTTYSRNDERINILFKNGNIKDISDVDNALIQQSLAATVGKQYICWANPDYFA